ncbi:hypothetical protein V1505DRAFT_232257 [Lipomyces doorenjongii]
MIMHHLGPLYSIYTTFISFFSYLMSFILISYPITSYPILYPMICVVILTILKYTIANKHIHD